MHFELDSDYGHIDMYNFPIPPLNPASHMLMKIQIIISMREEVSWLFFGWESWT